MRELTRRSAPVLLAAVLAVLAAAGPLGAQEEAAEPSPERRADRGSTQGPAPLADAELAFTRGVLAFNDGDLAAAREHFEEALRLAPGDPDAREWLELTRRHLDRPAEAALAPRPEWAGDFAVLPEAPGFEGRLYLGAGSDSNPNLMPPDLVLATPDGDPVEGEESDLVLLADARFAFQHASGGAGAGPARTWGLVLRGSQALHEEFGYLDLGRVEVVGHLALGKDPLGYLTGPFGYARVPFGRSRVAFLAQVGTSKDWLDGEGFADRVVAGASVSINEGAWGQTRVSASYRDEDFDGDSGGPGGEVLARSGERTRGELAQYLFFGRRNRYLRLAVATGERDAGAAFDASSEEASAEASLPLGARWTLYLAGALRREDYDEPASNLFAPFGEPREDDETRLGASLVFRALDRLFVSGRVTWIDHEIDLPAGFATPDLSYERTIATVGVSWIFDSGGSDR
jgi:hypothetical protein